ncbi:MAG: type II secretion system protein E [Parcubacteria group bacterium GW2011_GWA1_47_10]|uniref:Type II secretion system protein E n=1 Tax=Candidatus Nomurabacteria bacterium GW2011_GWB1_47_6 TaxID=1618749 RepID=A0A0G1VB56_9BACT|nr:MAG: type II secretion system protein E [Parcubacteria group bacterium GW2011_GWA1_47_10]KKU75423.1 MAG: type II secretion system protein E [Candidatus Nomurabacteria bacterium GW2011_GWB1_47_6]
MSFLDELAKKGIINKSQIGEIKSRARNDRDGIDEALIETGLAEDKILQLKGEYLNLPVKKVNVEEMSFEALKYISADSAEHYQIVPLELKDGVLEVGILDPENIQAMDALEFISTKLGIPFKVFLISRSDYKNIVEAYKGMESQVEEALEELGTDELDEAKKTSAENLSQEIKNIKSGEEGKIVEDAPVIKIVAVILRNALEGNASDIHIEHTGEKIKVRFRVDGMLHTTITLPPNVYSGVVARVKILAKLRLDEKRKPQDGSFSANIDGRKIDFRVSTMPAYYGEKVVMRILDSEKGVKPMDQLGLSEVNLKIIRDAIKKPYGLILITGPTGSGKSTTLYSMMNELDKETSNIVSLEDPVEYHMPDINQSQMMPEIGYTFASGLRSILRQDPDIIMVGEIRDKETAQLAIQAALTGHLVLSTLHTNSAVGAIPRLVDMGVDPYLIAPTLIVSIAQRLARLTYPASRKEVPMDPSVRTQVEEQMKDLPAEFRPNIGDKMYEVVPSPECPSGTRGRIAVFEMFKVDKEMQNVILKNPVNSEIYRVARKNGMLMMREDAMLKSLEGLIPFTEVYNFNSENE